jgi:hypothetical protein
MVKADKKNIVIISIAVALSVGGALIFYYLVPRKIELKKPFDPENRKKIRDIEYV